MSAFKNKIENPLIVATDRCKDKGWKYFYFTYFERFKWEYFSKDFFRNFDEIRE